MSTREAHSRKSGELRRIKRDSGAMTWQDSDPSEQLWDKIKHPDGIMQVRKLSRFHMLYFSNLNSEGRFGAVTALSFNVQLILWWATYQPIFECFLVWAEIYTDVSFSLSRVKTRGLFHHDELQFVIIGSHCHKRQALDHSVTRDNSCHLAYRFKYKQCVIRQANGIRCSTSLRPSAELDKGSGRKDKFRHSMIRPNLYLRSDILKVQHDADLLTKGAQLS